FVSHTGWVGPLVVSTDGRWLASVSSDNRPPADNAIRLWDLTTYQEVRRLAPRKGMVFGLAFSADSRLLASAGGVWTREDNTGIVQVWDVATGRELRSFTGHTAAASGVAFSPDGRT